MSWLEWQGEVWPVSQDEAQLHALLWPPGAGCPRVTWSLSLAHYEREKAEAGPGKSLRYVNVDIGDLNFHENDWRRLAHRKIKADVAWHAAQEHTNEYGRLDLAEVSFRAVDLRRPREERPAGRKLDWTGHAFIARFGAQDGLAFSCEIDAWLLPTEDYYRQSPETAGELAFPEEPPNLRIITRAVFTGGAVCMPRCGDDPLPLARRFLREEIGCAEIFEPKCEWAVRKMPGEKEYVRMPGFASTVNFKTQPARP